MKLSCSHGQLVLGERGRVSSSDRLSVSLCPAAPPTHPARCLRKHRTRTSSPLLYSYPNDIVFDFEPEPVFRGSQASVCSCVPPPPITSHTPHTPTPALCHVHCVSLILSVSTLCPHLTCSHLTSCQHHRLSNVNDSEQVISKR